MDGGFSEYRGGGVDSMGVYLIVGRFVGGEELVGW